MMTELDRGFVSVHMSDYKGAIHIYRHVGLQFWWGGHEFFSQPVGGHDFFFHLIGGSIFFHEIKWSMTSIF